MGYYFPQASGPRVIYLDERYDYPLQVSGDPQAERERQAVIWTQLRGDDGTEFLDKRVEEALGANRVTAVQHSIAEEIGTRYSAEYYERVFSALLNKAMNIVIISTGVRPFDGENYHDIGYLTVPENNFTEQA